MKSKKAVKDLQSISNSDAAKIINERGQILMSPAKLFLLPS